MADIILIAQEGARSCCTIVGTRAAGIGAGFDTDIASQPCVAACEPAQIVPVANPAAITDQPLIAHIDLRLGIAFGNARIDANCER